MYSVKHIVSADPIISHRRIEFAIVNVNRALEKILIIQDLPYSKNDDLYQKFASLISCKYHKISVPNIL